MHPVSYAYGWAPGPPPAKSGPASLTRLFLSYSCHPFLSIYRSHFPFPSPPLPFSPLPFPSFPLEVGPFKIQLGVWGKVVSSLSGGLERRPGRNRIKCILAHVTLLWLLSVRLICLDLKNYAKLHTNICFTELTLAF